MSPYRKHPNLASPASKGLSAAVLLCLMATAPWAAAQTVYRIVGPDGKVTFSDQPPAASANVKAVTEAGVGGSAASNAQLPLELRQAASRYPVTLYTSSDCAPCNTGRNLLNARGIPYTEKTVGSAEDVDALKRLSGVTSLPLLTIGGQQLKGFSDTEWTQYLDAAGYPKQSVLPASYRRPAPSALVAAKPVQPNTAKPAAAPTSRRPAAPAETPVEPPVDNPAGIRF